MGPKFGLGLEYNIYYKPRAKVTLKWLYCNETICIVYSFTICVIISMCDAWFRFILSCFHNIMVLQIVLCVLFYIIIVQYNTLNILLIYLVVYPFFFQLLDGTPPFYHVSLSCLTYNVFGILCWLRNTERRY